MKKTEGSFPPIKSLTIGGVPIEEFIISYDRTRAYPENYAAEVLQKYIAWSSGKTLRILRGMWHTGAHEIVLGECEKSAHLFPLNVSKDGVFIQAHEGRLYIAGEGTRGTLYAVYVFLEKYLGWRFFTPTLEKIQPHKQIDIPGSFTYSHSPAFQWRQMDWHNSLDPDFCTKLHLNAISNETWGVTLDRRRYGYGLKYISGLSAHSFCQLISMREYSDHPEYFAKLKGMGKDGADIPPPRSSQEEPCLSHPKVFEIVVEKISKLLNEQTALKREELGAVVVPITQNDNRNGYCRCERCRAQGTPTDLYLKFVSKVAAHFEKEYPNLLFEMLAYHYTEKPPSKGITVPRNVQIRMCPIAVCAAHSLNDRTCPGPKNSPLVNQRFYQNLKGWSKLTKNISIWEYTTNFSYYLSPYANFESLRKNIKLYWKYDVKSMFLQGNNQAGNGEFGELRTYLFSRLLWDPNISKQQFYADRNAFLKAYYGPAWLYIRSYLDLVQSSATKNNHFYCFSGLLPDKEFSQSIVLPSDEDSFLKQSEILWKQAKKRTRNTEYESAVKKSELSFRFYKLSRELVSDFMNGDSIKKAKYQKRNSRFLKDLLKYRICMGEGRMMPISFHPSKPPYVWHL